MHLCHVNLSVELYKVTDNKCNKNHSMGSSFKTIIQQVNIPRRQDHKSAILTQFTY
jgi:hypothetical protein